MVKRIVLLVLPMMFAAGPLSAQEFPDFPQLDIGFGYGNWGVEVESAGPRTALVTDTDRVNAFTMHTGINLDSWFGIENYLGAYALPSIGGQDITLIANIIGGKLVARDILDGRVSPYVVGGIGFGYYTSNQTGAGFSAFGTRYAGGIDFNLGNGLALRVDVGSLGMSKNPYVGDFGWNTGLNVSTAIVFGLGF